MIVSIGLQKMENDPNEAAPPGRPPIEERVDEVINRAKEILEDVEKKSELVRGLVVAARAVVRHAGMVEYCSIAGATRSTARTVQSRNSGGN